MTEPVLSIIIPLYNMRKYVTACMDSIVCQRDFTKFEVIVVDDGSTDDSAQIVQNHYASKYPNVRLYTQCNSGVSAARNAGMAVARGRYISFVDPDDRVGVRYEICAGNTSVVDLRRMTNLRSRTGYSAPGDKIYRDSEFFTRMIKIGDERDSDIVLGNQITVMEMDTVNQVSFLEYVTNRTFDASTASKKILLEHSNARKSANFAIYRRDFLMDQKLLFAPGMQLDEDMLFCDMALMHANRVTTVMDSNYLYNKHDGTLSMGRTAGEMDLALVRRYLVLLDDTINRPEHRAIFMDTIRRFTSWRTSMAPSGVTRYFPYRKCCECNAPTCKSCPTYPRLQKQIRRNIRHVLPGWEFSR